MQRNMIDSIGEAVVFVSENKRIAYANRSARKLFGIDLGTLDDTVKCCDVLNLDMCAEVCPAERLSSEDEVVNNYPVKREGSAAPYCVSTSIFVDDEGNRDGIVHTIKSMEFVGRPAREQKKIGDRLRRERMRMQAIFDSIADGVYTVDGDGRILNFSKSMEKLTGFCEEEVLGKNCADVLRGNICATDCPISWGLKEKKGVEKCREVIVTKDGRAVPVFVTTSPHMDESEFAGVICTVHDRSEIEGLRRELHRARFFPEMIGRSKKMVHLLERLDAVSVTDATVLIEGETGTGKELVSRAIHQRSDRNRGPFVAVDCSALPPSLAERALFGHEKGAFTGSERDEKGKLEMAEGGTLFLDEISNIPPEVQIKLLHFLQFGEFERVGGTKSRKADIRVIAATDRDLKGLAMEGNFSEDLYHRLKEVYIHVPPLRDRKVDIPLLVEHFIEKHGKLNPRIEGVSKRVLKLLSDYSWPGNVRELENAVLFAMASCPGKRIGHSCLPPELRNLPFVVCPHVSIDDLETIEKQRLQNALIANNWRVIKAAESIGYSRITMWRRMKKFGIKLPNRS